MNAKRVKETTQAVQRSIDILEMVASLDDSIGVSALARLTGLSKATAYRLCQTLVDRQFLEQNAQTGEYRLGIRLLRMSSRLLGGINLAQISRPILEEMARTGRQNAFVGQLESMEEMLICEEVRVDNPIQPRSLLGARFSLLAAPGGLICLATLEERRLEPVLKNILRRSVGPDSTIQPELTSSIRSLRGCTYSLQEDLPHRHTTVICSPVMDRHNQAMGVVGYYYPQLAKVDVDLEQLGSTCSQAARSLSAILSG